MVPALPLLSCEFPVTVKENPDRKKTTVPQIWILNGKETGTIKWNCTPLLNLESLSAILFNRKKIKHNFLTKNLKYHTGP